MSWQLICDFLVFLCFILFSTLTQEVIIRVQQPFLERKDSWECRPCKIASSALNFLPRPFFYVIEKLTYKSFKPLLLEIFVASLRTHYSNGLFQSSVYNNLLVKLKSLWQVMATQMDDLSKFLYVHAEKLFSSNGNF